MLDPGNLVVLLELSYKVASAAYKIATAGVKIDYYEALVKQASGEDKKNQTPEQKYVSFMVKAQIRMNEDEFATMFTEYNKSLIFYCCTNFDEINLKNLNQSRIGLQAIENDSQSKNTLKSKTKEKKKETNESTFTNSFNLANKNNSYQDFCDAYDVLKAKGYRTKDIEEIALDMMNSKSSVTEEYTSKKQIKNEIATTGEATQKPTINLLGFQQDSVNFLRKINKQDDSIGNEPESKDKESNVNKEFITPKIDSNPIAATMNGTVIYITTREIKERMRMYNQLMTRSEAAANAINTLPTKETFSEDEISSNLKTLSSLNKSLSDYRKYKSEAEKELSNERNFFKEKHSEKTVTKTSFGNFTNETTAHILAAIAIITSPNEPEDGKAFIEKGMSLERIVTLGRTNKCYMDKNQIKTSFISFQNSDIESIAKKIHFIMGKNEDAEKIIKTLKTLKEKFPEEHLSEILKMYFNSVLLDDQAKSIENISEYCESVATKKEYIQEMDEVNKSMENYYKALVSYNTKIVEKTMPTSGRDIERTSTEQSKMKIAAKLGAEVKNLENHINNRPESSYINTSEYNDDDKKTSNLTTIFTSKQTHSKNIMLKTSEAFSGNVEYKNIINFATKLENRLKEKEQSTIGGTSKEKSNVVTRNLGDAIRKIQNEILTSHISGFVINKNDLKNMNDEKTKTENETKMIKISIDKIDEELMQKELKKKEITNKILHIESSVYNSKTLLDDSKNNQKGIYTHKNIRKMEEVEIQGLIKNLNEQLRKSIETENKSQAEILTLNIYTLETRLVVMHATEEVNSIEKEIIKLESEKSVLVKKAEPLITQLDILNSSIEEYMNNYVDTEKAIADICSLINAARVENEDQNEFNKQNDLFNEFYRSLKDLPNGDQYQSFMTSYVDTHINIPNPSKDRHIVLTNNSPSLKSGQSKIFDVKNMKLTRTGTESKLDNLTESSPAVTKKFTADELIREKASLLKHVVKMEELINDKSGFLSTANPKKISFLKHAVEFLSDRLTDIDLLNKVITDLRGTLKPTDDKDTVKYLKIIEDFLIKYNSMDQPEKNKFKTNAVIEQRAALLALAETLSNENKMSINPQHKAKKHFAEEATKYLQDPAKYGGQINNEIMKGEVAIKNDPESRTAYLCAELKDHRVEYQKLSEEDQTKCDNSVKNNNNDNKSVKNNK